ncbi:MAG: type I-E CRISPR-associated protein Cse2/CasB [Hyphomicrobiaceae bacterium]
MNAELPNRYAEQAAVAVSWLASLRPREVGGRLIAGDRAALARLRRASSVMEAAAEPATADLYKKLGLQYPARDLARAAVVAAVLAHVREASSEKIARAIGTPRAGDGSTAILTPLRLKRLLAAREPDDILIAFRRVVAILGHTANIRDLALQVLAWTDAERGDITRTRFAFDYHGAGPFAPGAEAATAIISQTPAQD